MGAPHSTELQNWTLNIRCSLVPYPGPSPPFFFYQGMFSSSAGIQSAKISKWIVKNKSTHLRQSNFQRYVKSDYEETMNEVCTQLLFAIKIGLDYFFVLLLSQTRSKISRPIFTNKNESYIREVCNWRHPYQEYVLRVTFTDMRVCI